MRYPASEKLKIIRIVEQSQLPVRRTLDKLGGLRDTHEAFGAVYGVSATPIGQIVRDLKKEGAVRVGSSRSGTTIVPVLGLAAAS
jgi:hypothetical protein